MFTDLHYKVGGITPIAVFGILGALSLMPARFVTEYLMSLSKKDSSWP